jgi:hypothetical protein
LHYVPIVGETPSGNLVAITWARTQEVMRPFYNAYFDEGAGHVSEEFLNNSTHLSPEQFDLAALQSFLAKFGAHTPLISTPHNPLHHRKENDMPSIDIQGTQLNADEISLVEATITKVLTANSLIESKFMNSTLLGQLAVQILTDLASFRKAKSI